MIARITIVVTRGRGRHHRPRAVQANALRRHQAAQQVVNRLKTWNWSRPLRPAGTTAVKGADAARAPPPPPPQRAGLETVDVGSAS